MDHPWAGWRRTDDDRHADAQHADRGLSDREAAQKLNHLTPPLVAAEEERLVAAEEARFPDRDRIFMVEATLLLEAGGKDRYDRIVVVDADPDTQETRAVMRGVS